jgi:hypothetical protein
MRKRAFQGLRTIGITIARFYGFETNRFRVFAQMHKGRSAVLRFGRAHVNLSLITDDERAQLLAHGQACAAGQRIDPPPVVRLFTPDAHATWLLTALDPADGDTAYGLIDLGIGMPALGTVQLSALASIVGPRKQPVMRDRYFQAVRPLSEYVRLAQENGSITD